MAELLNCPFCGRVGTLENPEPDCYAIGCDDCCFSMMEGNVGIGWYATEAEAIAAWNRRAPSNDARDAERIRVMLDGGLTMNTPHAHEFPEVLPCPFCGCTDIGHDYIETYSLDSSYVVFGCKTCGARVEDWSAKQWNSRAALKASHVQAEAVAFRYFANGPEGSFATDNAAFAEKLIGLFDPDDWTVTDLHAALSSHRQAGHELPAGSELPELLPCPFCGESCSRGCLFAYR